MEDRYVVPESPNLEGFHLASLYDRNRWDPINLPIRGSQSPLSLRTYWFRLLGLARPPRLRIKATISNRCRLCVRLRKDRLYSFLHSVWFHRRFCIRFSWRRALRGVELRRQRNAIIAISPNWSLFNSSDKCQWTRAKKLVPNWSGIERPGVEGASVLSNGRISRREQEILKKGRAAKRRLNHWRMTGDDSRVVHLSQRRKESLLASLQPRRARIYEWQQRVTRSKPVIV